MSSLYDLTGNVLGNVYEKNGDGLTKAYDISANEIDADGTPETVEEQTGTPYMFSDMSMTDESNITTQSSSHVRNATTGIKLTASQKATPQKVIFACQVPVNGERCGIWLYVTRRDLGVAYAGSEVNGYRVTVTAKVNNTTKALNLVAGMNYYPIYPSEVGDTITSIEITINSALQAGGAVYLDSVEVGYYMTKKPIVMFNFDMSPNNFITKAGFNVFAKYGFHATLQYVLTENCTSGSAAVGYSAESHQAVVEAGHDYATYSGWEWWNTNVAPIPAYDDVTHLADFQQHADYLWHINNDVGVYAPSIIHSTGFGVGEVYDTTLCDAGFPLIRAGNGGRNGFASVDWNEYREIPPYFNWGAFGKNTTVAQNIKDAIFVAIKNRMCLQIGGHTIQNADYEPGQNDMHIGVDVIDEVLAYCKTKVDAGQLVVCTTAEFLKRCMPRDKYAIWLAQRQRSFVY